MAQGGKEIKAKRIFIYDGKELPDPDPGMSIDAVRQTLTDYFPELGNATHKETKRGDDQVITFTKRVGTKGAKRSVEIDIPDGAFCNPDNGGFCPLWWMNEDGEEGCALLGEMRDADDVGNSIDCKKFAGCPNLPAEVNS